MGYPQVEVLSPKKSPTPQEHQQVWAQNSSFKNSSRSTAQENRSKEKENKTWGWVRFPETTKDDPSEAIGREQGAEGFNFS